MLIPLDDEHLRLVNEFGSQRVSELKDKPDFRTINTGLIFSHRDFDIFFDKLKRGEKVAIVSGLNPSSTLHLGHKGVFDTNLFFQKEYGVDVFIPLSDDESYLAGKLESQKQGHENAKVLIKQLLAFGFDPKKTYFILDQVCTSIYNLSIKFAKKLTSSMINATYGYTDETNVGLKFYPSVQAAHICLPLFLGYTAVLVPIGIDEDAHIRIARDLAAKFNLPKCAVLHSAFMPGLDGQKMSKSRPNSAIFFDDNLEDIRKKIMRAYSGGRGSLEAHRRLGGIPEEDVALRYLLAYFLDSKEAAKIEEDYKSGKVLSSEIKEILYKKVSEYLSKFKEKLSKITDEDAEKCLLKPGQVGNLL